MTTALQGGSALRMTLRESLYLDLVRSIAAFIVIIDHAPTLFDLPSLPRWGHHAVMVFFVLSGYVICHVADTRENTPRVFLIARFARLWSVLVPAMILTVACDWIGRHFGHNASAYVFAPIDYPFIRIFAALTFLSESWFSIQPLSNGVIWSLCAEFWYYMLFAAWVFAPPGRMRIFLVGIGLFFAGHKALLLLPIWIMGIVLERSIILRRLGPRSSLAFCIGGFLVVAWILATSAYDPAISRMRELVSPWIFTELAQARVFWFDWVFGAAVAAHLLGARKMVERIPVERIIVPIRWCAGVSFAAYLFHMPLLHLWAAFLPKHQGWLAIGLTLTVIAILGRLTERSKNWWRWLLERLLVLMLTRGRSVRAA